MAASPASSTSRSISTSRRAGSRRLELMGRLSPLLRGGAKNLSARGLLRLADVAAEGGEFLADGGGGVALDLAVARNQGGAERRQHGAAAILAAGLTLYGRLPADAVDLVDQVPGAFVGHVHGA